MKTMLHGHYIELLVWACARREIQINADNYTLHYYMHVLIFQVHNEGTTEKGTHYVTVSCDCSSALCTMDADHEIQYAPISHPAKPSGVDPIEDHLQYSTIAGCKNPKVSQLF